MKKINHLQLEKILKDRRQKDKKTEKVVREIIERVKKEKDKGLLYYTEKFDKVKVEKIKVEDKEIEESYKKLDKDLIEAIKISSKKIEKYHKKQIPSEFTLKEETYNISFKFKPVESAGIYIPGGQSPLISTILMSTIPAKIAGVKNIHIATPPSKNTHYILGTCKILGIKNIYRVGGAQAIAAFAYGTETIPEVDIIVGPGNKYVNTCKKIISGDKKIDLPAGPSEVVIFSDSSGNSKFIEYDLKAQMEHTDGFGLLITTDEKLGEKISKKVKGGYLMIVKNKKEALKTINLIAPEHLQIISRNPSFLVENSIAGAIFIGNYTPATIGDYFAGPSHILPTEQTARFFSGLSVFTFLRSYAVIEAKKEFYKKYGKYIEKLAETEGLKNHSLTIKIRDN